MLGYIVLSLVCIGLFAFSLGAVFLTHEEKPHRYQLQVTDEHEI